MSENNPILAIELENGKFTGVSSATPEAFDDVDIVVMNRDVPPAEATDDPLAAFDMTPVSVETNDADDGIESSEFSVGRVSVAASAWALEAMVEAMAADAPEGDELEETEIDADLVAE